MVEGGAATIYEFLKSNFWDECRVIETPKLMGNGLKAPMLPKGKKISKKIVGDILHLILNVRY
jgi:riboflavin biosynthesis pyrimidine reductase